MTDTIAPYLVRWLTHDLASPIATMMTLSELLSDTPDHEINGLVQDAARGMAARLRLIRSVLAPGDSPVGGAALEKLLRDGIGSTPIKWASTPGEGHNSHVIAGTAMLLADLRRNHALTVTASEAHWDTPFSLPKAVIAALAGGNPSDGRSGLAAMLLAAATKAGMTLKIVPDGISWA